MSKTTWLLVGAAATLMLLRSKQRAAAPALAAAAAPADINLSGIDPAFGGSMIWRNDRPSDGEVSPASGRGMGTNPIGSWLEKTFGISVPQIAPAYRTSASAPNVTSQPMNPAGAWTDGNVGMAAVPGTWPESTSTDAPFGEMLSNPNLLMSIMPFGDDFSYVPDPVLY